MDSNHETLVFHSSIWWLSKVNMLAGVYEMKDELMLFFKRRGKQDCLLFIKLKEFYLTLSNLTDIFKALNDLNLILQGKNINFINDYNAINTFIAKLGLTL